MNKNKNKRKNGAKPKNQRRTKKNMPKRQAVDTGYLSLITNPCHGPLVRSGGPGGNLVERVRSTQSVATSSTSGYLMFFPAYHGLGSSVAGTNQSIFLWENSTTALTPANTSANPLGSGGTSGTWVTDPAAGLLSQTSPFSRARTISACTQLEYLAALSTISGQIAVVKNVSLSSLDTNTGGTGSAYVPPSVDAVFNYAAVRERLSLAGHEVISRPFDNQNVFRVANEDSLTVGSTKADSVWTTATVGVSPVYVTNPTPSDCYATIVAWRGIAPVAGGALSLNIIKVVELELAARQNQIESVPSQPVSSMLGGMVGGMQTLTSWLDAKTPGWQYKAVQGASAAAGKIAEIYAPAILAATVGGGYPPMRRRPRLEL